MIRSFSVLVIAAALAPIVRGEPLRPLRVESLEVQGLVRTVRYYEPARMATEPALLIVLHGSGGDGERIRQFTAGAFERVADQHGFLVAYPDALGRRWTDCRLRTPYRAPLSGIDDLAFLRSVTRRAAEIAHERLDRIYVAGYSNGGHLVLRLAQEAPEEFAGFAAIGAHLPVAGENACKSRGEAVPIVLVSGTEDPINPFSGGEVRAPGGLSLGEVLSAEATSAHFVELASAIAEPELTVIDRDGADGTLVESRRWRGAVEVLQLKVVGGGHSLPQPSGRFPERLTGRTSREIDGARSIWEFFARQSVRPPAPAALVSLSCD